MIAHELHSIKEVSIIGDHTLRLRFEDNSIRDVNLEGILEGELFGPLRDPNYFRQVSLDREFETVVWPNGADFDPETLYHWDRYRVAMIEQAKNWK